MAMKVILHHTQETVVTTVQYRAVEALNLPEKVTLLRSTDKDHLRYAQGQMSDTDDVEFFQPNSGFFFT